MTPRILGLLLSGFAVRIAAGLGAVLITVATWQQIAKLIAAVNGSLTPLG